jgi:hypothetical protein
VGLNKPERENVDKQAQGAGYRKNSEGDWQNGSKKISYSESGGSVNVNGHKYNSSHDVKKSGRV